MEYKFKNYSMVVPAFVWANDMDKNTKEQLINLSSLPFAFHHACLMGDGHFGYGMPIGGVLATKDVIIPNAVGVDIGCGVACCKIPIKDITKEQIKSVFGEIRKRIPIGFNHHNTKQNMNVMPDTQELHSLVGDDSVIKKEFNSALKQVGTLGGGNHFIEIQKESDGYIYIMIHSGSRNLGYKVAKYYNEVAKDLNKKWFSSVNPKWDLALLPVDSQEGQNYLSEMNYCVEFAKASRKLMMMRCVESYNEVFSKTPIAMPGIIDVSHNYVAQEHHFGKNVWVHRKGATRAYYGEIGLIPGSQGTNSYIVRGLGNPESFMSCSHGAGRTMSRKKAKENLNLKEEIKKMEEKGIVHGMRNKNDLDEASSAYKDIHEVMDNQKDLVEIVTELTPLGVIKG